jgi:Na+:H+ antiporter, NhaA family
VRLIRTLREFLALESAGGILLALAAAAALALANSPLAFLYDAFLDTPVEVRVASLQIAKPLLLWINDGLMAVFFFLVGLEIKREVLEGELSDRRQIVLPAVAAICGMAAPALIYAMINASDPIAQAGWAIPAATDIAFALGVLSLLGSRVPAGLKVFLLTVAILDDLGAIVIIALFYSDNLAPASFGVAGAALLALLALNRSGVVRVAPYLFVGMIMWVAVLKSGVHATLAGVALAFFIPLRTGGTEPQSPLRRLEQNLHPLVAFAILPLFAFANSGVSLQGVTVAALLEPVPLGIAAGLLIGKTVGVFLACWLTVQLGFARLPGGANWMSTLGVSVLCGIGFTMSLFIAGLAFNEAGSEYIVQTRLGILGGSLAAALLGYALLRASLPARSSDTAGSKAGRTPSRAD